ncbi:MAG: hypothetical protein JXX28_04880 [Deltaproteobacteria bacterium]|nr:hypothetical protein [Deltaproteobacteria bacterium]
MGWRGFFIAGAVFAATIVNVALIVQERVPQPDEEEQGLQDNFQDALLGLVFTPSTRQNNFEAFGFTDEQAEEVARRTARLEKSYGPKLEELLNDFPEDASLVFCPNRMPQRVGALAILVQQVNDQRRVIDPAYLATLEEQEWWAVGNASVEQLYDKLVVRMDQHDSTVMMVGAVLLRQEDEALRRKNPWGSTSLGGWSYKKLLKNNPGLEQQLAAYFSLMHLLTEIANKPGGLCEQG